MAVANTAASRAVPIGFGGRLRGLGRSARRRPNITFGLVIVGIMILIALMAPVLFTSDPNATNPQLRFQPPSFANYWFGSDNVGRDV